MGSVRTHGSASASLGSLENSVTSQFPGALEEVRMALVALQTLHLPQNDKLYQEKCQCNNNPDILQ